MVLAGALFQQRLVGLSYEALRSHAELSKETWSPCKSLRETVWLLSLSRS